MSHIRSSFVVQIWEIHKFIICKEILFYLSRFSAISSSLSYSLELNAIYSTIYINS